MKPNIRHALPLLLLFLPVLTSCGTSTGTASGPPPPLTNLDGNWQLTGNAVSGALPALSATMMVVNSQVDASLAYTVSCGAGATAGGAWAQLIGSISPDGYFSITNAANALPDPTQFTITGRVPNAGHGWIGTYSIASNSLGCNVNQAGIFTASPVAAVSGTYAGAVSSVALGTSPTINLQVSEGSAPAAMAGAPLGPFVFSWFPLSGAITVNGSSCFSQGSIGDAASSVYSIAPGVLAGDAYSLAYAMNDGSTLVLSGDLADPSTGTLATSGAAGPTIAQSDVLLNVIGGNCDGANGTVSLTRQ